VEVQKNWSGQYFLDCLHMSSIRYYHFISYLFFPNFFSFFSKNGVLNLEEDPETLSHEKRGLVALVSVGPYLNSWALSMPLTLD